MSDPYGTLGISANATDAEVRAAYRRLVQLHHPDHNAGSQDAARRFEEVQEAYAEVRRLRAGAGSGSASAGSTRARSSAGSRPAAGATAGDPHIDTRLRDIERELREANAARERARQAAREAAAAARAASGTERAGARRASDEELGYVTTDDSLSKILSDARDELFGRVEEVRESPAAKRVTDLIDELAEKLKGE